MDTWAHVELRHSAIPNTRRRNNAAVLLNRLSERPGLSFSSAAGHALRQSFYRLSKVDTSGSFPKPLFEVDDIMSGHTEQTKIRCAEESRNGMILMVQDTTMFNFDGLNKVTNLGYCNTPGERRLFGHSVLALDSAGLPLGIAYLELWSRDDDQHGKSKARYDKEPEDKESYRWVRALHTVEDALPEGQVALFIQDREADIFELLAAPKRATTFLLIRAGQSRRVEVDTDDGNKPRKGLLMTVAREAPVAGQMEVVVPRSPNRESTTVTLLVQNTCLRILSPTVRKGVRPEPVTAWVVRASELNPPANEKAIEWILITTLPVTTVEQACQMVRYYSRRWMIERLHYTIKSGGCNAEKLQMDDAHSLKLAVAFYYITAWRLLYITHLAREKPQTPVTEILDEVEIQVLQVLAKQAVTTCAEAVIAVAKLGGYEYYKNAPPPGVKRLWIGLRRLEDMVEGWKLAIQNTPPK